MSSSPIKSILLAFFVFVLAGSLAAPARAQAPALDVPVLAATPAYHATLGAQHAKLLRSRDAALQEIAMKNIIVLASLRPDSFNLTPVVPALLAIYEFDRNQQRRILATAALRAVGDKYGMDALYRLSEREHPSLRTVKFAQRAVKHYYVTRAMEREEERAAYYLAKGDLKKADRHTRRADAYRKQLG